MRRLITAAFAAGLLALGLGTAHAQQGMGPFMPNEGGTITTAWSNAYGPDAESWMTFAKVGPQSFDINYSSSRGMRAVRRIMLQDRYTAQTLVLGYNSKMPLVMPNTTTLGTSAAVLEQLRTTGSAPSSIIYDAALNQVSGAFQLVNANAKFEVQLGNQVVQVPAITATGQFKGRSKSASGTFTFLNNKNNPVLLEYSINFSGEAVPRTERVVRAVPGAALQGEMQQALATVGKYRTYGIHFDFDKASIRAESQPLINDMVTTLQNNPLWTLRITGYTDSIGDPAYNKKLSQARADSLKAALVKRGVNPARLQTAGAGASNPVGPNNTLQGRALNRRVELERTDR
ncbi:OmpA family protein [Aestuariivirga sp.]|uniref:OmpA family protein n=1 Tax=Aestuariivirga sp. TaxID=2650926 RepID=UPI003BA8704E